MQVVLILGAAAGLVTAVCKGASDLITASSDALATIAFVLIPLLTR